jgi:hypothetical protein
MVLDREPDSTSDPEPKSAANDASGAALTQEQREFARVLARLLARLWTGRAHSEPPSQCSALCNSPDPDSR